MGIGSWKRDIFLIPSWKIGDWHVGRWKEERKWERKRRTYERKELEDCFKHAQNATKNIEDASIVRHVGEREFRVELCG